MTNDDRNSFDSSKRDGLLTPALQESPSSVRSVARQEQFGPKLSLDTALDVNVNNDDITSIIINTTSTQQPIFHAHFYPPTTDSVLIS